MAESGRRATRIQDVRSLVLKQARTQTEHSVWEQVSGKVWIQIVLQMPVRQQVTEAKNECEDVPSGLE